MRVFTPRQLVLCIASAYVEQVTGYLGVNITDFEQQPASVRRKSKPSPSSHIDSIGTILLVLASYASFASCSLDRMFTDHIVRPEGAPKFVYERLYQLDPTASQKIDADSTQLPLHTSGFFVGRGSYNKLVMSDIFFYDLRRLGAEQL